MDRSHIIAEIQRTAIENGGNVLGRARFETETGIKESDWSGKYWARWSDACLEAGFSPNSLQGKYDDGYLVEQLAEFVKRLGHWPTRPEIKIEHRNNPSLPSANVFDRLGRKRLRAEKVVEWCTQRDGFDEVLEIAASIAEEGRERTTGTDGESDLSDEDVEYGWVYLLKSGKYHKIGRTMSPGRREYEIALQLPEKVTTVHRIKTDDPTGIEAYWHNRFVDKRANGEWFTLNASDVRAFKRRKFM